MNQRRHKHALYRRIRTGRITALIRVLNEIGKHLQGHIVPEYRPAVYDEYHKWTAASPPLAEILASERQSSEEA